MTEAITGVTGGSDLIEQYKQILQQRRGTVDETETDSDELSIQTDETQSASAETGTQNIESEDQAGGSGGGGGESSSEQTEFVFENGKCYLVTTDAEGNEISRTEASSTVDFYV